MEKKYKTKIWGEFEIIIIICGVLFLISDILLWLQGSSWAAISNAIFLELAILLVLFLARLLIQSQQIILDEQGITQIYRGGPLFSIRRRTVNWKDILKIEGEFGFFHIGDNITLYTSRKKMKIFDIIIERDRFIITNTIKDFKDLVGEVSRRAYNAQLDKGLKKFIAT
jgi:hypothetical protein